MFFSIDHNTNALIVICLSLFYKSKTCLSCDKFVYPSRMMLVDKNEVNPFQKSPMNVLDKNGILLKNTPFFKTKF